jgi:hypothetical protein
MITPQELRIGNWLEWDDESHEQVQVEQITCNKDDSGEIQNWFVNGGLIEDFVLIPLTEEWLLKFGFNGDSILGTQTLYRLNGIEIWAFRNDKTFMVDNIKRKKVELKFVHQLQNLYFALTGQELTPLVRN